MEYQLELDNGDGTKFEAKDWEKFNFQNSQIWMNQNWTYSIHFSLLYIVLIHLTQHLMKNKRPFQLKTPLLCWNALLAIFSIVGFWRTFPELFSLLRQEDGFYKSVCSRENQTIVTAFWSLMSAYSKVAELFDTGFVVLRKQPLIFLHWYHHTTVMLFTWWTYVSLDPSNRWMLAMNYFIHGIMYTYYALRAAGFKPPRFISMVITSSQLIQMVLGVTVNIYTIVQKRAGVDCSRLDLNVILGLLMYFSYLLLFAQFFRNAYLTKKGGKSSIKKE